MEWPCKRRGEALAGGVAGLRWVRCQKKSDGGGFCFREYPKEIPLHWVLWCLA